MITRVLDRDGNVIHDCAELGCETSWDGYTILRAGGELKQGDPLDGRTDPDPDAWAVTGSQAREL